jgi:hypothetical protein
MWFKLMVKKFEELYDGDNGYIRRKDGKKFTISIFKVDDKYIISRAESEPHCSIQQTNSVIDELENLKDIFKYLLEDKNLEQYKVIKEITYTVKDIFFVRNVYTKSKDKFLSLRIESDQQAYEFIDIILKMFFVSKDAV